MNEKRVITEREEEAYKLCHHDFSCLSTHDAADVMGVSQREVELLLTSVKKKAPQLFPILTLRQKQVHDLWLENKTYKEIAKTLLISTNTVNATVDDINKKYGYIKLKIKGMLSFNDSMEGKVKQKF